VQNIVQFTRKTFGVPSQGALIESSDKIVRLSEARYACDAVPPLAIPCLRRDRFGRQNGERRLWEPAACFHPLRRLECRADIGAIPRDHEDVVPWHKESLQPARAFGRKVTAVGLSDEHPSRERAADGGRELREIMQGQQRTERAMLGSTASPSCGEQPAASAP
jgi:hypothetical protein